MAVGPWTRRRSASGQALLLGSLTAVAVVLGPAVGADAAPDLLDCGSDPDGLVDLQPNVDYTAPSPEATWPLLATLGCPPYGERPPQASFPGSGPRPAPAGDRQQTRPPRTTEPPRRSGRRCRRPSDTRQKRARRCRRPAPSPSRKEAR